MADPIKPKKQFRILLADSHRVMLEGLKSLLEPTFEIVGMVENVDSLLSVAGTLRPDVVIVHFTLAFSHQGVTMRALMGLNSNPKIIVISPHDDPTVMRQALDSGAVGFVHVRTVAWDLIPAIHAVLHEKTYVSAGSRWS